MSGAMRIILVTIVFDVEAFMCKGMGDGNLGDRFVVSDGDGLVDERDADVCSWNIEFIAQRRLDSENATRTVQIVDDKIRYFVHPQ